MTTPYYSDDRATVLHGDCLALMADMPDASMDAVVTDPPYGLGFMGKAWDDLPPGVEWAAECLRVLKPGGHLLAFGGSRTWHRLAVAAEDAGFEIRDSIAWLYGSGFPKSLDVSKAIDKAAPRHEMFGPFAAHYAERRVAAGLNHREVCEAGKFYLTHNKGGASVNWEKGYNVPTLAQWATLAPLLGLSDEFLPLIERIEAERDVTGRHINAIATGDAGLTARGEGKDRRDIPATPDAERWQGWGTALKPAFEPIVVARKPLAGTVAANVLTHGTGALNIDGCRVGHANGADLAASLAKNPGRGDLVTSGVYGAGRPQQSVNTAGRWPANVVLDDSQAAELDAQSGETRSPSPYVQGTKAKGDVYGLGSLNDKAGKVSTHHGDSGGASRFFPTFRYQAKAPNSERPKVDGIAHPTVKPLALMQWLIRLVTPPGGTILDPFAGSGTTIEAALREGVTVVGIEREVDYLPLILHRIERHNATQPSLDLEERLA